MSLEFPAVSVQILMMRAGLAGDGLLLALCPSCHVPLGSGYFFGVRNGDVSCLASFCEAAMYLPAWKHPCPFDLHSRPLPQALQKLLLSSPCFPPPQRGRCTSMSS